MPYEEHIFTVPELSEYLRIHRTTIYRLLSRGLIPGFRVGNSWRFSVGAIEKWEHSRRSAEAASGIQTLRRDHKSKG
jgi:excisionase family DNA binding protein